MVGALGLPGTAGGLLLDLDGVLTLIATHYAAGWKLIFDELLTPRRRDTGQRFVPLDSGADYDTYVDGTPQLAGTQSVLASELMDRP
jgi:beta-phosphoglucomutase-like phosphatase (HAD superfamily)